MVSLNNEQAKIKINIADAMVRKHPLGSQCAMANECIRTISTYKASLATNVFAR